MEIPQKFFICFLLGLFAVSMYIGAYGGIVRRRAYAHGSYTALSEAQSVRRGYGYLAGALGATVALVYVAKSVEDDD
ncbi:MAG: hypothetical protein ACO1SV_18050 [Fimbriimonas sp.]